MAYTILAPHTKLLDMVRPAYHFLCLSFALALWGRFRVLYIVLSVLCVVLDCLWTCPHHIFHYSLVVNGRGNSCVNPILDRDGRGCGRCRTVWFSIFSCRRGRTSRIEFLFFKIIFGFSTSCERCGSACHVSDVQVQGSKFWFWFLSVTVQDEFMGYALCTCMHYITSS